MLKYKKSKVTAIELLERAVEKAKISVRDELIIQGEKVNSNDNAKKEIEPLIVDKVESETEKTKQQYKTWIRKMKSSIDNGVNDIPKELEDLSKALELFSKKLQANGENHDRDDKDLNFKTLFSEWYNQKPNFSNFSPA